MVGLELVSIAQITSVSGRRWRLTVKRNLMANVAHVRLERNVMARKRKVWGKDQKLSLAGRDDAKKAESSRSSEKWCPAKKMKLGLIGWISVADSAPAS